MAAESQRTEHHHGQNIDVEFSKKYLQKMMEPVETQGWEEMMPLPTNVYSNLVKLFNYNLEVGTLDNVEFTLYSRFKK